MPNRFNNLKNKENRKAGAAKRAENILSPQDQLKKLDSMFGVGQGARKERIKLRARLGAV